MLGDARVDDINTGMPSTALPSLGFTVAACSTLSHSTRVDTWAAATGVHLHAAWQVVYLWVCKWCVYVGSPPMCPPPTEVLDVYRQAVLRLQHVVMYDSTVTLSTIQHFLYDFEVRVCTNVDTHT